MNINYFLVEANRFKLNNYNKVPLDYIMDLISYIYEGSPMVNLSKKFTKGSVEENGKKYYYFNKDLKSNTKAYSIINTQKYLATMSNNTIVKQIYVLSFTDNAYKELAFVLFLLGVVNTEDYLPMNRDISYIVSRFTIKPPRRDVYSSKGIIITLQDYISLMGLYYKNAMKGVRYGVNPLDFVWNAYKRAKDFSNNEVSMVMTVFKGVLGDDVSFPQVDFVNYSKYLDELAILAGVSKLTDTDKSALIKAFVNRRNVEYSTLFEVVGQPEYIELNDDCAVRGSI